MTVLKIIGVLVFCFCLLILIVYINKKTYTKYKFELFDSDSFFFYLVSFGLCIYGLILYDDAVRSNGDELNGILLVAFAVIILIKFLYQNIKYTSFFVGIFLTILQIIIHIPLVIFSLVTFLVALLVLSNIKPVYTVNQR